MALWIPTDISDTKLWWDPSDAGSLTMAAGEVAQLADKGGGNVHFGWDTANQRPTLTTINGRSALHLLNTGKAERMRSALTTLSLPALAVVALRRGPNAGNDGRALSFARTGGLDFESTSSVALIVNSGGSMATVQGGSTRATTPGVPSNQVVIFAALLRADGTVAHWLNGSAAGTGTGAATSYPTSGNFLISLYGTNDIGGASVWSDAWCEGVVVYGSDPSGNWRQYLEGYMAHRWGSAALLPSDHPYKNLAPGASAGYRIIRGGFRRRGFIPASSSPLTSPSITGNPTISGTVQVGNTVTAVAATVGGNPAPSTTWQWNLDGSPIAGAAGSAYTPLTGQAGGSLTVTQTATNSQGSVSATSAGSTIAAASSGTGEIETVTISNGGTGTLDAGTAVFGMLFQAGEFPSGTKLEGEINGITYAVQSDVRTTHEDGSAKHAILAVPRPGALTAGSSIAAKISSVSGAQAAPVDLRAAMVATPVSVRMTVTAPTALAAGEITFDASAAIIAAIDAGTIDYRLRGPRLTRGRVQWNPHGTNSAMRVVVDVTAWADGHVTVDANYCNDVIVEWGVHHGLMTFSARVLIGGTVRGSLASLNMLVGAHWLIKATTANCPHGTIMHQDRLNVVIPLQRWIDTALTGVMDTTVPADLMLSTLDNRRATHAATWEQPFYPNGLTASMGEGGTRWEIGPVATPCALFLRTGDFRMARWMRSLPMLNNGIPWHFFDRANNRFHDSTFAKSWWTRYDGSADTTSPLDSPTRWGTPFPLTIQRPDGIPPIGPDHAHHPDLVSVPYVTTGEDWILDQVESLAARGITTVWDGHRGGDASDDLEVIVNGKGGQNLRDLYTGPRYAYEPYQHRAVVWILRSIQNAAEFCRNGSHTKTWATNVFNKNIAAMKAGIPLWEATQGSYKGWWDTQHNVGHGGFQQAYGSLMMVQWLRRGAGGQDLRDFFNWHAEHWLIGRHEQTDIEWEYMTGFWFLGSVPKINGIPVADPTNYAHLFNARITSYAAARTGYLERNPYLSPPVPPPGTAKITGNYAILDMSVIWSARNWYADPSKGNNAGFAARLEAIYDLYRSRVPALPHTKLNGGSDSFVDQMQFAFWKPYGWNPYRNDLDLVPGVPTAIVSTPLAAVPDEPPPGFLICTVGTSAGAIRAIEIRNETVPGTLVGTTNGIVTEIRVANGAAIDFQTRTSFSFEVRIRNDGADGADWSAWLPLSFDITAGTPVVGAGVFSITEHAPTATPPVVLSVGQVIGQVPILTPAALSGAPEITTQSPAGAASLGAVTGTVPNLLVPLLVADPEKFDNEGTNPVLVTVRAPNAKGDGAPVEQRINLINVVEPGDPAPLLLDELSVPNTTVMACGGLMRLTRRYGGPLIRVYNLAGDPLDVGAGAEWVNWAHIAAHIGSARGTVEIYDQITGGIIANANASRRPYISTAGGAMITAPNTTGGRPMIQFVSAQGHRLVRTGYTIPGPSLAAVMFVENISGNNGARALSIVASEDAGLEVGGKTGVLAFIESNGIGSQRWGNKAMVTPLPADGTPITISTLFNSTVGQRSRVNGATASVGGLGNFLTANDLYLGGNHYPDWWGYHANMLTAGFCVLSATNETDLATIEAGFETLIGY